MSDLEYLKWFAKTLGYNIGLMHKNGFEHHYIDGGHNVTLDCRIVDLDGIRPLDAPAKPAPIVMSNYDHNIRDQAGLELYYAYKLLIRSAGTIMGFDERYPEKGEAYKICKILGGTLSKNYNIALTEPQQVAQ
jgi:hypothetical protein